MKEKIIPIFFASDRNYIPYLTVAIKSMVNKINNKSEYRVYILTNDVTENDIVEIRTLEKDNFKIEIVDVNPKIESIKNKVALRDYYSVSIYFHFFRAGGNEMMCCRLFLLPISNTRTKKIGAN